MRKTAKRYYIQYEDNKMVCGKYTHTYCNASTLKSAKTIASKIKQTVDNARNIRVYDTETDDSNGNAQIVFHLA